MATCELLLLLYEGVWGGDNAPRPQIITIEHYWCPLSAGVGRPYTHYAEYNAKTNINGQKYRRW